MNREASPGPALEPVSTESTPVDTSEAQSHFDLEFVRRHRPDVFTFVVQERVSSPTAETEIIPVIDAPQAISEPEQEKPKGRHRDDSDYMGRHLTRGERKRRLESRVPVALGRLAYRIAAGLDRYLQRDDENDLDDTPTESEVQAPPMDTPRTFEQMVRDAEADRAQLDIESTERKRSRIRRIRNTVGALAASAALIASTSSITRTPDTVDALKKMTSKGTDKVLIIGDSDATRSDYLARKYEELDEKAKQAHTSEIPDGDTAVYPAEALKIDRGEGLFSTFKQLDIPASKWHALMDVVGPKLVDMGQAYYDKSTGEYLLPAKGMTTRQALHVIKDTAQKIT